MRILLALAAAACVTVLGCSRRTEVASPKLPDPDTTGMETPVVDIIRTARGRVSREPSSGEAWSFLAAVLDIHGFARDAETAYRRAMELAPDDPKLPYNLAVVLEDRGGDLDEVVGLYRRFAEREPKFPPVHFRIGGVLARKGDLAAAAEAYRTALSLDPKLTIARRSLGQVLIALDDARTAIAELERVAVEAPGDGATQAALAQAYTLIGDAVRATAAAAKARELEETLSIPDAVRFLVVQLGRSSRLVEARKLQEGR